MKTIEKDGILMKKSDEIVKLKKKQLETTILIDFEHK